MSQRAAQLALDLGHRRALGANDFLIADCNRQAVAWIDRWPDWPSPGLAIHGPPGCGKSHLVEVWRQRTGARRLEAGDLAAGRDPLELLAGADAAAVEWGDAPGTAGEETLLHLYNSLAERHGSLLLTATAPPARWPLALADLASRLGALPAVAIEAPDDRLLAAVMVKQFADRQLAVDEDVIDYLLARIERSFAAARALVAALDRAALAGRRPITVPLAREVLSAHQIDH